MIKLSLDIITPTLNAGSYIEYCLLSTSNLRSVGGRHIVVDSGSTDETIKKVDSHGIERLFHPPGNMYSAINKGIHDCNSEWVTYINGDDMLFSDSVMDALKFYGKDHDVIYGNVDYIDPEGRFLHYWKSATPKHLPCLFANRIMPFGQQGTLFRRSLWEKIGGFDDNFKYSADFDFFLRAVKLKARFASWKKKPIAAFRIHPEQISQISADEMQAEGDLSLSKSALEVGLFQKSVAKLIMRGRNLESYLVRYMRYNHLYQKRRLTRTIGL